MDSTKKILFLRTLYNIKNNCEDGGNWNGYMYRKNRLQMTTKMAMKRTWKYIIAFAVGSFFLVWFLSCRNDNLVTTTKKKSWYTLSFYYTSYTLLAVHCEMLRILSSQSGPTGYFHFIKLNPLNPVSLYKIFSAISL